MPVERAPEPNRRRGGSFIAWWLAAALLVTGIAIGRGFAPGAPARVDAADDGAGATATRSAELEELNDLRTRVAQPVVCTPAPEPTVTPTPTIAPPVPAGAEMAYGEGWTVTVLSIESVRTPENVEAEGQLFLVTVRLVNLEDKAQMPPFKEWRLVAPDGSVGEVNLRASAEIAGRLWIAKLARNATEERGVVFELPGAGGDTYVLESATDPTFRVQVTVESRG